MRNDSGTHGVSAGERRPGDVGGAPPLRWYLGEYARILYRRGWIAALALFVVTGCTYLYNRTAEPVYEAQATILIEPDIPHVVNFQEVLDEGHVWGNYYDTQYELLKSRSLALGVVSELALWKHRDFGGSQHGTAWLPTRLASATAGAASSMVTPLVRSREAEVRGAGASRPEPPPDEAAARMRAAGALLGRLQILPVRGSRLVNVRIRSSEPKLAAEVANAHARRYIEENLELRFAASKQASDWLAARLAEERERVERSEAALQAYREKHDAFSLAEGQDIVVQKLTELNTAVTRAKTNRIEQEARYRHLVAVRADRRDLDAVPAILSNPLVQQLKVDLARLQREYAQLSETLGQRHPTLTEKRRAIEAGEIRLQAEISKVEQSLESEFRTAVAEESSLTRSLEEQKREALALNRSGIEYGVLKREADSVRLVYETLLQRAKETGVSRDLRASSIRIIDPAQPPSGPVKPRKTLNMLFALLGGCLLGLGLAFVVECFDDRIRTAEELRGRIGLAVLGLIPQIQSRPGVPPVLHEDVPASFLEAFRSLRTNVLSASAGDGVQSVVVASANAHEGRTTVAANLAVALAQAHQRVVLIDADLRTPGVHALFWQDLEPGLSDVLTGRAPLDQILRSTRVPGLSLITAGGSPPNAPELLGWRFASLLDALSDRCDWAIVDSPPALQMADAAVLARSASGVILVVGSSMTARLDAIRVMEQLQRVGLCIGTVLNRATREWHGPDFLSIHRRWRGRRTPVDTGVMFGEGLAASARGSLQLFRAHISKIDPPTIPLAPVPDLPLASTAVADQSPVTAVELDPAPRWHVATAWLRRRFVAFPLVLAGLIIGGALTGRYLMPSTAAEEMGTLRVTSTPPGASIAIDGRRRGVTPLNVGVTAGDHLVEVVAGGTRRTLRVSVASGSTVSKLVELPTTPSAPAFGRLQIRTEPSAARVIVDGRESGRSPLLVERLTPGTHQVVLVNEHGSVPRSVTIDAGVTTSLVAPVATRPVPAQGWLAVSAPVDVQVLEGRRLLGRNGINRIPMPSGIHALEFVNEPTGYRVSRTVDVRPGRVSAIALDWPNGSVALNAVPWAQVWINGERIGDTPIGGLMLPVGRHQVAFRHPDLGERRSTILVTPDGTARLGVDLRRQ